MPRSLTEQEIQEHGYDECQCCAAKDPIGGLLWYARTRDEEDLLCTLCASTLTSIHVENRNPDADVLRTICAIGNIIRKDIQVMLGRAL